MLIVKEYITQIIDLSRSSYGSLIHKKAEEVIRCKDCGNRDGCWCQFFDFELMDFEGFCAWADSENESRESVKELDFIDEWVAEMEGK